MFKHVKRVRKNVKSVEMKLKNVENLPLPVPHRYENVQRLPMHA